MESSKYFGWIAPFGYKKDTQKSCFIIDEVASKYVKLIFSLALEGKKATEIARELNNRNVPTPSLYMNLKEKKYNWKKIYVNEENHWTDANILRILKDFRYTGSQVSGKYSKQ